MTVLGQLLNSYGSRWLHLHSGFFYPGLPLVSDNRSASTLSALILHVCKPVEGVFSVDLRWVPVATQPQIIPSTPIQTGQQVLYQAKNRGMQNLGPERKASGNLSKRISQFNAFLSQTTTTSTTVVPRTDELVALLRGDSTRGGNFLSPSASDASTRPVTVSASGRQDNTVCPVVPCPHLSR
eukprot:5141993-Amphidinium_carterae.1